MTKEIPKEMLEGALQVAVQVDHEVRTLIEDLASVLKRCRPYLTTHQSGLLVKDIDGVLSRVDRPDESRRDAIEGNKLAEKLLMQAATELEKIDAPDPGRARGALINGINAWIANETE